MDPGQVVLDHPPPGRSGRPPPPEGGVVKGGQAAVQDVEGGALEGVGVEGNFRPHQTPDVEDYSTSHPKFGTGAESARKNIRQSYNFSSWIRR